MSTDANPPAIPKRTVRCPTCGGKSVYASENPHRPFCSARCRNVDFGAWANESYRVVSPPVAQDTDPDEPPPRH